MPDDPTPPPTTFRDHLPEGFGKPDPGAHAETIVLFAESRVGGPIGQAMSTEDPERREAYLAVADQHADWLIQAGEAGKAYVASQRGDAGPAVMESPEVGIKSGEGAKVKSRAAKGGPDVAPAP